MEAVSAERSVRLAALRGVWRRLEPAFTGKSPAEPGSMRALFEGMVAGHWSIFDRFEAESRRFLVLRRNEPRLGESRGLSIRETCVAELLGLGRSEKEITYLIALSPAAVSRCTQQIRAKLGLETRPEVAGLFSPAGIARRLREVVLDSERFAIGSAPVLEARSAVRLSGSERIVARAACRGVPSAAIAAERGTSARTVDNQLGAIYRKLGVHSRSELAAITA